MTAIGIDLGTSNSLICLFDDKTPKPLLNALGSTLTPSAVSIDENGEIIIGQAAVDRLVSHPDFTVASFKRAMGTDKIFSLGKHRFRAEELSAFVLRSLKHDAENYLGEIVTQAVISVPAYFNDTQRKATINAARLAGLTVERLVNEPTAAALAHGMENVEEGRFLILDLGGGTFDVSLLHKYDGVMEIRASAGDSFLGGDDFRQVILASLAKRHELDTEKLELVCFGRMVAQAEQIKRQLSEDQSAQYEISLDGRVIEGEMTRSEFEEACQPLLKRMRTPIERVIKDSRLDINKLDQIVLVGGGTRIPLVRNLVVKLFGRFPTIHPDPDQIIGLGAAVQSALCARDSSVDDIVMTDICPFTLGTVSVDQRSLDGVIFHPIIERNAIVPISREETFYTAHDGQTMVRFEVLQGEHLRPSDNIRLGEIEAAVPSGPAGQEAIAARFTYDVNGALEVIITVVSTKRVHKKIFQNNSGLTEEELVKRFAALGDVKLAPRDQAKNRALIARAERIYAESLGPMRQHIQELIVQFEADLQDQTLRDVDRLRADFEAALAHFDRNIF